MCDRSAPSRSAGGQLQWPSLVVGAVLLLAPAHAVRAQAPETAPLPSAQAPPAVTATPATACAKIWLGHEAEYEELMRSAKVTRVEELKIGVTRPRCAFVEPGLPFSRMAWKTLKPGTYRGFYESYRSEIAAYELDKLIGLGMIPPSVERHIKAEVGAAILWVEDVKSWDVKHPIRGPDERAWARQWVRLKMFDQLSGNIDRNQGNLLYDSEYHVILIDHSRAFRDVVDLSQYQKYLFVDAELWERMQTLTMETIEPTLGKWVSKGMLYAVLQRRDRMKKDIDKLLAARGPSIWLR
jgi:hypothetical protein